MAENPVMYLSIEELWRLSQAMRPIEEAFGGRTIYLVGSVLTRADYRDVDLRLILSNSEYDRLFSTHSGLYDKFRMLLQTAISAMLRENTRLPIDFQIQSQYEANTYEGKRNPITMRPYIMPRSEPGRLPWLDESDVH